MSISDLYSEGDHQNKLGLFANLVKLALADNNIGHDEQVLLDRMAKKLTISSEDYIDILRQPENYPITPSANTDERIEQLYHLTRMIYIDEEVVRSEVIALQKIVNSLGFPVEHVKKITKKAIYLIINKYDVGGFTEKIKAMEL